MIWLFAVAIVMVACALFLAEVESRWAGPAMALAALAVGLFVGVGVTHAPPPAPVIPPHGPACADLAWLDGKWTCIPMEEQG